VLTAPALPIHNQVLINRRGNIMSTVAVLGASDNPERTAYQAIERLLGSNHDVIPVSPKGGEIFGLPVVPALGQITRPVDTLTMYVGPDRQGALVGDIVALKPRRVIFNPGTENPSIYPQLQQAGIAIQEACTLVLLSTRQFDAPV
jgi:predicted CoA-binding protein